MNDGTSDSLLTTLKGTFGLSSFRLGQKEILESVLQKKDTMAVMPTGGGKSLCYQLPGTCFDGIVVVISPLIALMEDQVQNLKRLGIPAACIHSGQTWEEKQALFKKIRESKRFILYLSPERVQKEGFATWAKTQNILLFAIDESHCVSQWGPDFRRDYYKLSILRQIRPDVPILALTATATPMVLRDIIQQLGLRDPARHIYGFYRPGLYIQVETCETDAQKLYLVKKALEQTPTGRVLIYCGTRKQCEEVSHQVKETHSSTGFYHAGLSTEERNQVQALYESGEIRILAATNAFGMGIDHADVRLVIHFQMPANVESYYQEIGRAGRDGEHSTCLMLYSKRDKGLHSYFITQSESDPAITKRRWKALDTMVLYAEGGECRHAGILTYFRDTFRIGSCGHCDVCAPQSPRKIVATVPAPVPKKKARPKKADPSIVFSEETKVRIEVLREWRKAYAEEKDIPAFLVFSNRTLDELAQRNPTTLSELSEVHGFGPVKTEHLGQKILDQLLQLRD